MYWKSDPIIQFIKMINHEITRLSTNVFQKSKLAIITFRQFFETCSVRCNRNC